MDWKLFTSTLTIVFLAELPDKTAIAVLLMSSRLNPKSVFLGTCLAFALQSLIAVSFGSLFGLLPPKVVHLGAALMFFVFAIIMWTRKQEDETQGNERGEALSFFNGFVTAFMAIFVAEWGDLTQLATAALQAQYRKPVTIFCASTLALWASTGLFVMVGYHAQKFLNPKILQKVGALAFLGVGVWILFFQK